MRKITNIFFFDLYSFQFTWLGLLSSMSRYFISMKIDSCNFDFFAWTTLQLKVIQVKAFSFISCRLNDRLGFK